MRTGTGPQQEQDENDFIELENEIAAARYQVVPTSTAFIMLPRSISIRDLWEEWFTGNASGKPSIWSMNRYQKGWRKNWSATLRSQYMFKRRLINAVLAEMLRVDNINLDLEGRIAASFVLVEETIDRAGSLNQFYRSLQKKKTRGLVDPIGPVDPVDLVDLVDPVDPVLEEDQRLEHI